MTTYWRILSMACIMIVQQLVFALMVYNHDGWLLFFIIWWVLAGFFWYQFIKAMRGE